MRVFILSSTPKLYSRYHNKTSKKRVIKTAAKTQCSVCRERCVRLCLPTPPPVLKRDGHQQCTTQTYHNLFRLSSCHPPSLPQKNHQQKIKVTAIIIVYQPLYTPTLAPSLEKHTRNRERVDKNGAEAVMTLVLRMFQSMRRGHQSGQDVRKVSSVARRGRRVALRSEPWL